MSMLKDAFNELLSAYTTNESFINDCWSEIEKNYSNKNRHYHNLKHLDNLLLQLTQVKDKIENWEIILFTLFYHDVIYNSLKSNNEEKSSELAEKRMTQLNISIDNKELCKSQILATKSHMSSQNSDTNYFTDADLSVLGQSWEMYEEYYKNVRKEYFIYPDFIYNPGRKKVLQHFLSMDRIYKTDFFYNLYETQAKENMQRELGIL